MKKLWDSRLLKRDLFLTKVAIVLFFMFSGIASLLMVLLVLSR